jgi:hypothetical protein
LLQNLLISLSLELVVLRFSLTADSIERVAIRRASRSTRVLKPTKPPLLLLLLLACLLLMLLYPPMLLLLL